LTFDLVTSKLYGSSTEYDQSSYHVPWPSLINFSRYWADMVFTLNATVTLTFDLVTSNIVWVIYWPRPIIPLSTMTVTQKFFKILSGHGLCIKLNCDLDTWPLWHQNVYGSSTEYDQSSYQVPWLSLILFKILSGHGFCIKSTVTLTFDLVTSKFIGVIYTL